MNEILRVQMFEDQEPAISGREMHEFLEIATPYSKWFGRMAEYGFIENQDFATVGQKCPIANGGFQERTDHLMKIDMAKETLKILRKLKGHMRICKNNK